jgi:ADP-ribose pyrophosphatase YjhB (NUDIX family)
LHREIKEETGIKNLIRVIEDLYCFEFSDPNVNKEYVYGVEVSATEKVVLDGKEHSECRWCGFQEALQLLHWKENKEALEKAERSPSQASSAVAVTIVLVGRIKLYACANTKADINRDNAVDIYDAISLANHYNQHYP